MNYLSAIKLTYLGGYSVSSCTRPDIWEYRTLRMDCAIECDLTTKSGLAFIGEMHAYQSEGSISGEGLPGSCATGRVQNLFDETVKEVLTGHGCQILRKDKIKLLLIRHEKRELPVKQIFQGVITILRRKIEQHPKLTSVQSAPLQFSEIKANHRLETTFSLNFPTQLEAIKTNLKRYTLKRISRILYLGYTDHESPLNRLLPDVCRIIIALCAERLSPQESTQIAIKYFSRPELCLKGRITSFVRQLLS